MTVYAVFRSGVYRHECGGIFTDRELAIATADRLALAEPDDHHSYDVVPFEADVPGEPDPEERHHGGITEPRSVYSVGRSPQPRCKSCHHEGAPQHDSDGICKAIVCRGGRCTGWDPDGPPPSELRRQVLS